MKNLMRWFLFWIIILATLLAISSIGYFVYSGGTNRLIVTFLVVTGSVAAVFVWMYDQGELK